MENVGPIGAHVLCDGLLPFCWIHLRVREMEKRSLGSLGFGCLFIRSRKGAWKGSREGDVRFHSRLPSHSDAGSEKGWKG